MSAQTEPRELPATLTPVDPVELAAALGRAWRARFGLDAERKQLLVLVAQWAFETGWGKWCRNYNLGNVKRVKGDGRSWCYFRCNEIIGGKEVWFDPPHPACAFRAFDTLDEGAADYLGTLSRNFAHAWPAVVAGDPADFAHRLKQSRYYTASEEVYARSLVSIVRTLDRKLPMLLTAEASFEPMLPLTDEELALCPHNGAQSIAVCLEVDPAEQSNA